MPHHNIVNGFKLAFIITVVHSILFNPYLDNQELNELAQDIAEGADIKLKSCTEDSRIRYMEFGDPEAQIYAIITCNIHAREVVTAQICLNWAKNYLNQKNENFQNLKLKIFYDANLNRELVFKGQPLVRKDENGVDINRNFPTEFNFYHTQKSSLIYGGPYPFSEPFSQCLERLVQEELPTLYLDIHSGQNGVIYFQESQNDSKEIELIDKINEEICDNQCKSTTLKQAGQSINGHIFADLKVRMGIKYSLLFETYMRKGPVNLYYFNPQTRQGKRKLIQKWSAAIQLTLKSVVNNESTANDD